MGLNGRKCREAGEDCIMRSFITFMLDSIRGDQFKEHEVGRAYSTHE